jgi:hypothetical protein
VCPTTMANNNSENPTSDRRDPLKEGSSLSGSNQRDNVATEKAVGVRENSNEDAPEVVDQDPGERQKENQNDSKDDPLAA